jgi:hypothetical protein
MFYFPTVRAFNQNQHGGYNGSFFLDKNPGSYEIKILNNGDLSRSIKFSVGPNGKMVDNGVVSGNKIGGIRSLVPVEVIGTQDGTWNKTAWQTDAFYANPLNGFTF